VGILDSLEGLVFSRRALGAVRGRPSESVARIAVRVVAVAGKRTVSITGERHHARQVRRGERGSLKRLRINFPETGARIGQGL
jgi:hypothetical protein